MHDAQVYQESELAKGRLKRGCVEIIAESSIFIYMKAFTFMFCFTLCDAVGRSSIMFITAFFSCSVYLKVIWLVKLGNTVPVVSIRKPRTIPSG